MLSDSGVTVLYFISYLILFAFFSKTPKMSPYLLIYMLFKVNLYHSFTLGLKAKM